MNYQDLIARAKHAALHFDLSARGVELVRELAYALEETTKLAAMNWVENQAPLEKRLNEALSLAQRYREALEFYAKPEHWTIRGVELPSRAVPLTWGNEALADKGTRAREALAGKEGG